MNQYNFPIVTHRQAETLKQLGFDWKVAVCYVRNPHLDRLECFADDKLSPRNYNKGYDTSFIYHSYPEVEVVCRWLLLVHKIHCFTTIDNHGTWRPHMQMVDGNPERQMGAIGRMKYASFELALSSAVDEALNYLVKISRNKLSF